MGDTEVCKFLLHFTPKGIDPPQPNILYVSFNWLKKRMNSIISLSNFLQKTKFHIIFLFCLLKQCLPVDFHREATKKAKDEGLNGDTQINILRQLGDYLKPKFCTQWHCATVFLFPPQFFFFSVLLSLPNLLLSSPLSMSSFKWGN